MKSKFKNLNTNNGFSLVELLVVIAIMIILISLLVPMVVSYIESAHNATDIASAKNICNAIQMHLAVAGNDEINLTDNPWGENSQNHGYIYIDDNEIRTSSLQVAKILEENNVLTKGSTEHPNMYNGSEPRFSPEEANVLCKSHKSWNRYQINFTGKGRSLEFTYIATRDNNSQDIVATNKFAQMVGGTPAPSEISMGDAD